MSTRAIDPDDLTELADGDRLVERITERFHFTPALGWLRFADHLWAADQADLYALAEARTVATTTLMDLRARALFEPDADPEWRKRRLAEVSCYERRSRQIAYAEKLVRYASQHPTLRIDEQRLDAKPHLLATPSGIVDLRDGTLRPGRPEDLISRATTVAYDPDAPEPRRSRIRWRSHRSARGEKVDPAQSAR